MINDRDFYFECQASATAQTKNTQQTQVGFQKALIFTFIKVSVYIHLHKCHDHSHPEDQYDK